MSADVRDDAATVQRLVGVLVASYGYPLNDDTETMAAVLATVALARLEAAAARSEEIEKQRLADFEHANYIASCAEERIAELVARTEALEKVVRAARELADHHRDFLGLPVLLEGDLDAAVANWAALREELAALAGGDAETPR